MKTATLTAKQTATLTALSNSESGTLAIDGRLANPMLKKGLIEETGEKGVYRLPETKTEIQELTMADELEEIEMAMRDEMANELEAAMTDELGEIEETEHRALINPDHSRYHTFADVKTSSGRASYDIADTVANALRGLILEDVYSDVATYLAQILGDAAPTIAELQARYEHLNVGMQRMNLGNKLRAAMKKHGVFTLDTDATWES